MEQVIMLIAQLRGHFDKHPCEHCRRLLHKLCNEATVLFWEVEKKEKKDLTVKREL